MKSLPRRLFLQKIGAGLGATAIAATLPSFIAEPKPKPANYEGKKLNIALCGLGRYAGYLASGLEISQYCHQSYSLGPLLSVKYKSKIYYES